MRYIYLLVLIIFSNCLFAQEKEPKKKESKYFNSPIFFHDSVEREGEKYKVAYIPFQFEVGPVFYFFDKSTKNYFDNGVGYKISGSCFINTGFMLKFTWHSYTAEVQDTLVFEKGLFTPPEKGSINGTAISLGYFFSLGEASSITPYASLIYTGIEPESDDFYSHQGIGFGVCTNVAKKLKPMNYLVFSLDLGYGFTNFDKLNPNLGDHAFFVSFGIGYRLPSWKLYSKLE